MQQVMYVIFIIHFMKEICDLSHINMHKIRANKKHGTKEPVITVKTSKTNTYGHEVEILGESKVVYSPDKPLSCGARVWIETNAEVKIDGQTLGL